MRLSLSLSGGSGSSAGGGLRVPQSPVMTSYSKRVTLKKLRTWRVPGECKCCPDLRVDPKIGFALVDNMPSPYDQVDRQIDRQILRLGLLWQIICPAHMIRQKATQIDRQLDRQIDRQIDRYIDRQIDRQIQRFYKHIK